MNLTHAHLLLNPLSIIGSLILFLFFIYALLKKNNKLIKTLLWFFILVALITIPVYFTGEPAEETVLKVTGMDESIIERHEETALYSLISVELLGILAIIGLLITKGGKPIPAWTKWIIVIVSFINVLLLFWTANLGGEIRHTEIRSGNVQTKPVEDN
jgi:hypothetical protein